MSEGDSAKTLLPSSLLVVLLIGFTFSLPYVMNFWNQVTEIQDFSYAALISNINENPDDKVLFRLVERALDYDAEITGQEYRSIFDYMIAKDGMYKGAQINQDHTHSKQQLIALISNLNAEDNDNG